jgi:hypothetical protein
VGGFYLFISFVCLATLLHIHIHTCIYIYTYKTHTCTKTGEESRGHGGGTDGAHGLASDGRSFRGMYVCMYVCVCAYIYAQEENKGNNQFSRFHTHTHTCTHIHTHRLQALWPLWLLMTPLSSQGPALWLMEGTLPSKHKNGAAAGRGERKKRERGGGEVCVCMDVCTHTR